MPPNKPRIVVVGSSGAGKSTLARRLAARLDIPHIELDAINWQANWQDLARDDPAEFIRRVRDAIAADGWVVDGNYGAVRDMVWRRATHLIWLDYSRRVVMVRVIARSFWRVLARVELWGGNRERWRDLLASHHPMLFAWSMWARNRSEMAEWLARPEYAGLAVLRLRRPGEARALPAIIAGEVPPHPRLLLRA